MAYKEKVKSILDYFMEIVPFFQVALARAKDLRMNNRAVLASEIRLTGHLVDKEIQLEGRHTHAGDLYAEKLKNALVTWDRKYGDRDESIVWAKETLDRYATLDIQENKQIQVGFTEQLRYLIQTRRSIRRFTKEKIKEDVIARIIEAGKWAPSSCNRQSWKFTVVRNPILIKEVGSSLFGGAGFASKAATIIVTSVDLRMYSLPRDRNLPYLDGAAATMNMLLTVHAMGLGGCWLNWKLNKDSREVLRVLKLEKYETPISAIVIGYPEIIPPPPKRIASREIAKILD
jgi:nitroreductase